MFILLLKPEIRLAAVGEYGRKQTTEICLAAAKNNALQYVHEQTREICLAAVTQNGWSLRYVHYQTYEIYLAAVDSSGRRALDFLKFFGSRAYHL